MATKTFGLFLEKRQQSKRYKFSSLQYNLPRTVADKIIKYGENSVHDDDLHTVPDDPTFGREKEVHCTALYGIHDKSSENIRRLLRSVKPFKIKLGDITAFTTPPAFDVLKVDVVSPELHRLHHLIRENLDVTITYPDFKPHVTIAYMKKGSTEDLVGDDRFKGISMVVDKLIFSSTAGTKSVIRLN